MRKLLKLYKLLEQIQKIKNLNDSTSIKEIELITKKIPTKKNLGPDGVTD